MKRKTDSTVRRIRTDIAKLRRDVFWLHMTMLVLLGGVIGLLVCKIFHYL